MTLLAESLPILPVILPEFLPLGSAVGAYHLELRIGGGRAALPLLPESLPESLPD